MGIYLLIVGLVTKIFIKMGFSLSAFLSFLAAFFVFFLFISLIFSRSLKQRLSLFIDRSFYRNRYDYRREWGNLNERLGTLLDMDELIAEVKNIVKQILQVETADVLLENLDAELTEWLLRYGEPISIEELSRKQPGLYEQNRQNLEKSGAYILVSLNAKQKLLGILAVGNKAQPKTFSNEDTELLKNISRQVSVAILNARFSEELIVTREMEHFHKLSSFIIHDLKNSISMLSMLARNADKNFDNPEFQRDALDTISGTIAKMNKLMQKLSALPKKLELNTKPANINALIEETVSKSKIDSMPSIKLLKQFDDIPQLTIDAEYMQEVIRNLLLNAIEAMPNGGSLTIETGLYKDTGSLNGKYVQMSFKDTGCGMSGEFIHSRLFKPFQSSKGRGFGIGLYQCKTIIEAHKGKIDAESRPGEGTTFTIRLPLNQDR